MRTNLRMTYLIKSGHTRKIIIDDTWTNTSTRKSFTSISKHPIGYRSKEFQKLVESTTKNLQWLHQTQNDVLTITGSGTAMEVE